MMPSAVEVEYADWPALKEYCTEFGLSAKGRSAVVRQRVLEYLRARTPPPAPWKADVREIAALLVHVGDPLEAAHLWESTLSLESPAPWVGLGAAYLRAGQLEKASKAFDRAARMGDPVAAVFRTDVLAARRDLDAAIDEVRAQFNARPSELRSLASLVAILSRAGRTEEVTQVLRRALEIHPDAGGVLRPGLGWALLGMSQFDEAAAVYREHLHTAPEDVVAWNNYGVSLAKAGRLVEAGEAFQRALALNPTFAEATNNLGCVEMALNREGARRHLAKASRLAQHPRIAANAMGSGGKAGPRRGNPRQAD